MKLLKFPILVLLKILKDFDEDTVFNMHLFITKMQNLMTMAKQHPKKCFLRVDFRSFSVDVSPFWKFTVSELSPKEAAPSTRRKHSFDGEAMHFNTPTGSKGDVSIYSRDRLHGVFKTMLEVMSRLKLKAVNCICISPESRITEIFNKLTEQRLVILTLILSGRDESGQGTKQVFASPVLEQVINKLRIEHDFGDNFELPALQVPINFRRLDIIGDSRWFTIHHLMKLERTFFIDIRDSMINSEDLRGFFAKWINKEFEHLKSLMNNGPRRDYHQIDLERVFSDVPATQKDIWTHDGKQQAHVEQGDGVSAFLQVTQNHFECTINGR